MNANKVCIDAPTAKLVADTYSKIYHLKNVLASDEFTELIAYLTLYKTISGKLARTICIEDRELFIYALCDLIDTTKISIIRGKKNICTDYVCSIIHDHLVGILSNLESIKNNIQALGSNK